MSRRAMSRWLSSSVADSVGRMMLQLFATVLFARRLAPEVFGAAALTMVIFSTLSVFVTAPFEEALTQRRRVRKAHFSASLAAVLLAAVPLVALSPLLILVSAGVDRGVATYALILLANGPISVLTALMRRQRRFGALAAANFLGQLVGTGVGLALAFGFDAEIWALLSVQLASRATTLAMLALRSPARIAPRWSAPKLGELSRFAGWHLAGRFTEVLGDAVYQVLITRWFGLTANGYLNLAMRIVEPIRGASGAIGHNLATALFAPAQAAPARFRAAVSGTIDQAAMLLLPVFVGLAATSPALMVCLAGPGWTPAVPLAVCLALGAAVGIVANLLHSALAASGRAEVGLVAGALDTTVVVVCLAMFREWGLVAVGLARLLPYVSDLVLVSLWSRRVLALPDRALLTSLARSVLAAGLMALPVLAVAHWPPGGPIATACLQVMVGIVSYLVIGLALQPILARRLLQSLR